MPKEMRRKDRKMPDAETMELLCSGEYGILSTVGEEGQPYGIPLSYVVREDVIYFHCAAKGHKIDNIKHQPQVCFTVVGKTQPIYDGDFTTYFESAVAFGRVQAITDPAQKTAALMALCQKYLPGHMGKAPADIDRSLAITAIYAIYIERVTGKAKRPGGKP